MKHLHITLSFLFGSMCLLMNGQINMSNATNTVNASTPFYDDGGGSANYNNSQNLTQVITTTLPNHRIKVTFASLFTATVADSLSIYDGTTPSPANFLVKYSGSPTASNHYSSGNSMAFRFVSDASGTAAGWNSSVMPFGIASLSQTTTSQSSSVTFTINGTNTDWTSGISGIYLIHGVSSSTIAVSTYSPISSTQLEVTFNIPCNADLGMYYLQIVQPVIGNTKMTNAFNVTPYDVTLTGTNILCSGYNTGAINSLVNGGSGTYTYLYNPGSISTPNPTSLNAGIYTLILTDGNACVRTQTITLTQSIPLSNGNPGSQTICSGQSAVLTMVASGGTGGYNYYWQGPNLSSNTTPSTIASPLSSTTYTYSVSDGNACTATSTLIVTVNPGPTVSITASPNIICIGANSNLSASGSATTYSWSTGSTNSSIPVTPVSTTVYSVTGTAANGCTKTETVSVTVNPLPVMSANTSTPLCLGGSLVFNNTSSGASIFSWNGPSAYASTMASPVITNLTYAQNGTYTLTGTSAATGCMASTTIAVTVNALPTLTLTSTTASVCAGNTVTINSAGASTYTWMPGSLNNSAQTFTPSSSTIYTVTGTNAIGCAGSNTIGVTVNALTAISGSATSSSNPVAGQVTLYGYEPFLTQFDSITTQTITAAGAYVFPAIPEGNYIVKATPSASSLQVTYGNSAISWQGANAINHTCIAGSSQNINVVPFISIGSGAGSLSGIITETVGFGQRPSSLLSTMAPGQPIGGIVVKGGKNPGGQMFAQTTTGADGTYTLTGLPNGNYFILVDIPGLDTNLTYHPVISNSVTNYTGLNFTVDSMMVNPIPYTGTGIKAIENGINLASVYPNPATNRISVHYTLMYASTVSIEITDVLEKTMTPFLQLPEQQAGTYNSTLSIAELKSGIYFIKLKTEHSEQVLRLMITD